MRDLFKMQKEEPADPFHDPGRRTDDPADVPQTPPNPNDPFPVTDPIPDPEPVPRPPEPIPEYPPEIDFSDYSGLL